MKDVVEIITQNVFFSIYSFYKAFPFDIKYPSEHISQVYWKSSCKNFFEKIDNLEKKYFKQVFE